MPRIAPAEAPYSPTIAAELKRQEEALMRSLEGESKPGTRP